MQATLTVACDGGGHNHGMTRLLTLHARVHTYQNFGMLKENARTSTEHTHT